MADTRKAWPTDKHFFQSKIMCKISKLSNPRNPGPRTKFIQDLEESIASGRRYVDVLHENICLSPEEIEHFNTDWFPVREQARWFPLENGMELENKLRQATLDAFKLAEVENKPLEYYWSIPIDDYTVQFEIITNVKVSAQQVTLVRITPAPAKKEG